MNKETFTAGCVALVMLPTIIAFSALLWGWPVMVMAGAFWHEFEVFEPISYWQSVLIAAALTSLSIFLNARK